MSPNLPTGMSPLPPSGNPLYAPFPEEYTPGQFTNCSRMKSSFPQHFAMNRRSFFRHAALAVAGAPFWSGVLTESFAAKIPEGIKITDLKSIIVEDEVYLKVFTDAGVTGEGHASVHRKAPTCKAAVDDLAR